MAQLDHDYLLHITCLTLAHEWPFSTKYIGRLMNLQPVQYQTNFEVGTRYMFCLYGVGSVSWLMQAMPMRAAVAYPVAVTIPPSAILRSTLEIKMARHDHDLRKVHNKWTIPETSQGTQKSVRYLACESTSTFESQSCLSVLDGI